MDKRERYGYNVFDHATKQVVDRDGDSSLVDCPKCFSQELYFNAHLEWFRCNNCKTKFEIHTEDGISAVTDHRQGNVELPSVIVIDDDGAKHIGLNEDEHPWWWNRKTLYQDRQDDNMDVHGHASYKIIVNK